MKFQNLYLFILFLTLISACKDPQPLPEPTTNEFFDTRDGTTYQAIELGSQVWMAENLRYEIGISPCYEMDESNCSIYGRLYTFAEAANVCPDGWHLPTDEEWQTLETHLGMDADKLSNNEWRGTDQGTQLKEGGGSGFRAKMAGIKVGQFFTELGDKTVYWSITEDPANPGFWIGRELGSSNKKVRRVSFLETDRHSVRCLKD